MSIARIHRPASPFNASELGDVDYVQSFDVVYFAHLNHDPTKLIRSGHTSWAFSSLTFGPTITAPTGLGVTATIANTDADNSGSGSWAYFPQPASYVVTAIDDETGQESRASNSASATNDLTLKRNKNVLSWDAVSGAERYRIYKADNQSEFGWIGDTESTSFTDDYLIPDLTDGPPEAFNPFTLMGNPSTVTFFEQRLGWGRMANAPNGLAFSRSADFENMDHSRPTRADDSIVLRIAAQKVNSVHSLLPLTQLLALTGDAIFVITGSSDEYLSANPPPRAVRQSGRGASRLKPITIDEVIFYQPSVGTNIRSLGFTFEIDGYRSNDVSIFSPGLFRGFEIVAWAYAEEPLSVIYAVRNDGALLAFTWQQEQQVWGWTQCETDGEVLDICAIQEGGESRVYLIVRRTIGEVRYFLERMASAKWDDVEDACYLDCAVSFEPTEPQQRFLVPHLTGETVDAFADGFVVRDITVDADGYADIGFEAESAVTIGLPYEWLVEPLPLLPQTREGVPANKRQQLGKAVVQVADTRRGGLEMGRREERLYPVKGRANESLGSPPELYTGMIEMDTEAMVAGEATIVLRHTDPTPITLLAAYLDPIVTEK